MCGIAGIIDFKGRGIDPQVLDSMTASMVHRGPDDKGSFQDSFVGLGFRRLSIIDVEGGHQPMSNEDDSIYLIFNGEIYNFKGIRDQLIGLGHTFKSQADSEIILHAYEQWGNDCVKRFNGIFGFALYDQKKRKVLLARDHLGVKPLYYARENGRLLFASEMKGILAHPDFERRPSLPALSSYLTFRYPQGDQPFFAGMKRLLPGQMMEITSNGDRLIQYWEIPFHAEKEDRGEAYYLKETKERLLGAVERQMISDVPLGAFLSGGLDSSIIVAMMSQFSKHPVTCFSIGFEEEGYNEFEFSKEVAQAYNANYYPIVLSQIDYMDLLPKIIRQKDAPLSIPHEVALNLLSFELKKKITVVISGEGADEIFGGYGRVQRSPMDYKKIRFIKSFIPKPLQRTVMSVFGAGNNINQWASAKSHMDHFFSVYNWIPFEEKWDLFTNDVNQELNYDADNIEEWQKDFDYTKDGNLYDRVLYLFQKRHLVCLLDRLDTMTMAAGVEARVPFLDHTLVEFVASIPYKYKLKWRSPFHQFLALFKNSFQVSEKLDESKWILRNIGKEILPKSIPNRKKLGFPVPLDIWIKQGMIKQAKEILLDPKTRERGIIKIDNLEDLMNNPQNLDYDFWGKKVWMLMNIELWFREFIDG